LPAGERVGFQKPREQQGSPGSDQKLVLIAQTAQVGTCRLRWLLTAEAIVFASYPTGFQTD
jgi:hypothetical protein